MLPFCYPTKNTTSSTDSDATTITVEIDNRSRHNPWNTTSSPNNNGTDTGHTLHTGPGKIPASWILLDSYSTVNTFSDSSLLVDIKQTSKSMKITCEAGTKKPNTIDNLPGFPEPVWHTPEG